MGYIGVKSPTNPNLLPALPTGHPSRQLGKPSSSHTEREYVSVWVWNPKKSRTFSGDVWGFKYLLYIWNIWMSGVNPNFLGRTSIRESKSQFLGPETNRRRFTKSLETTSKEDAFSTCCLGCYGRNGNFLSPKRQWSVSSSGWLPCTSRRSIGIRADHFVWSQPYFPSIKNHRHGHRLDKDFQTAGKVWELCS